MIIDNERHYAFDIEYEKIVREISTFVLLFSSHNSTKGRCIETFAVWDTSPFKNKISFSKKTANIND
jgi:hypothetical protein